MAAPAALRARRNLSTPAGSAVRFEDVSLYLRGRRSAPALDHASFERCRPAQYGGAWWVPRGGGKTTAASLDAPLLGRGRSGRVTRRRCGRSRYGPARAHGPASPSCSRANRPVPADDSPKNVRAARPEATRRRSALRPRSRPPSATDILAEAAPRCISTTLGAGRVAPTSPAARCSAWHDRPRDSEGCSGGGARRGDGLRRPRERGQASSAAFKRLAHGRDGSPRTVLMIAHRLSTVAKRRPRSWCSTPVSVAGVRARTTSCWPAGGLYATHVGRLREVRELENRYCDRGCAVTEVGEA